MMTDTQTSLHEINRVVLILGGLQQRVSEITGLYDKLALSEVLDTLTELLQKHLEMDMCCGPEGLPIEPGRMCGHCQMLEGQAVHLAKQAEKQMEAAIL